MISIGGRAICSTALLTVTSLARKGYLVGSTVNAQLLAELISVYTVANAVKGSYTGLSMYNVSTAASWLVEGVQLGMASGELPIALVTPSIQVVVVSELITTSSGLVLSTPPTAAQAAYGSIQPKITFGPNGLSACPFSGGYGYAQLSALQWSVNPYPGSGSMAVVSPLLRLTSSAEAATAIVTVSMQSSGSGLVKSQVQQDHVTISLPGVPAYYITLQFSSKQAFNFSAETAAVRGQTNFTLPACSQYNGAAYVPCRGCNISSYTDYNVTYSCFDITQLCPSSGGKSNFVVAESASRSLAIDRSYLVSGDKGMTSMRGLGSSYSSTAPVSSLSYGVLIQSIRAELHDVLSSNPFELDLAHSTVVLTFMGCLCGVIIIMIYYSLKRDYNDMLYKNYIKSEAENTAKRMLEEEIKNGGTGDAATSFETHSESVYQSMKKSKSISNLFARSVSGVDVKFGGSKSTIFLGVSFDFTSGDTYELKGEQSSGSEGGSRDEGEGEGDINDNDSAFGFENIYVTDGVDTPPPRILRRSNTRGANVGNANRRRTPSSSSLASPSTQYRSTAIVTQFLSNLFPGRSLITGKGSGSASEVVCVHHSYFRMFTDSSASQSQSRIIRFVDLILLILTAIFADTIFFGIFYPARSSCFSMTSMMSCIQVPSKIQISVSECMWNSTDSYCSLRPPPTDPVFTILVALLTIILSIPILILLKCVLNGYASNFPGSRGLRHRDDLEDLTHTESDQDLGRGKDKDKDSASQASSRDLLPPATTTFGREMSKGLLTGRAADYTTSESISQLAYSGTFA